MALKESDLKEIMFSAVRESGNKPIAVGTAKWLEAIRRLFSFGRIISYDPRLRWGVDYETSTGEVRHFKIFIFTDNESTPESVREDVRKAISVEEEIRALEESDLKEIIFSAVRESGNKPIAVGTANSFNFQMSPLSVLCSVYVLQSLEAIRRSFLSHLYDPRLWWGVDYETSTGEVRHFKIFTDNLSRPESVREDVRKAISEK